MPSVLIIGAYLRGVADRFGIRPRYGVEVASAEFDAGRWRVRTTAGEVLTADVLVPAVGQLSRPSMPDIPGRSSFGGVSFHSARWDHSVDLAGRRATYRSWQRRLFPLERGLFWATGELAAFGLRGNRAATRAVEWLARRHLRRQVADPGLRAKLTPDYRIGGKRVLFSNDYYPALRQPNVRLETAAITGITPTGVATTGGTHEVDAIIYGTGFRATEFLASIEVRGLDGRSLAEAWAGGPRAYLGLTVPGFPNMFLMYGPNTNLGSGSIVYMLERQARYIVQAVRRTVAEQSCLDVRPEVADRFDAEVQRRLAGSTWALCRSWYREGTGVRVPPAHQNP